MSNDADAQSPVGVAALIRSVRTQLEDLLSETSDLAVEERLRNVDRIVDCMKRRIVEMTPEELARVWAIFGYPDSRATRH
ncbi:hypothetical protein [Antrihabitans stalactiti]|uniref:hypothetical protein n=1 Tax=Antrihabitans stalactiti TaxID=2584121 RepID=UPI00146B51E2|nr:hypothetical protein [Antrihabitans stalactiti]